MTDTNIGQSKRRGRPLKTRNLYLVADVLRIHECLRSSKLGRGAAIAKTVAEVKALHPGWAISSTAVKDILHEYQPENLFKFESGKPDNWKLGVFRVAKVGNTYTMQFSDSRPFQERGMQFFRSKFQFGQKKT